jgi:hypothetical protein
LADFQSFSAQLLRCLKAEVLVHGNATAQEARALTAAVLETLKVGRCTLYRPLFDPI